MNGMVHHFIRTVIIIVFVSIIPHFAFAAVTDCDPWTAKAVSVQGTVEARSAGGGPVAAGPAG